MHARLVIRVLIFAMVVVGLPATATVVIGGGGGGGDGYGIHPTAIPSSAPEPRSSFQTRRRVSPRRAIPSFLGLGETELREEDGFETASRADVSESAAAEFLSTAQDDSPQQSADAIDYYAAAAPVTEEDAGPATVFGDDNFVDGFFDRALGWKNDADIPIKVGAWHWFAEDIGSSNDGYGVRGLRGTYWWEIIATPSYDLGDGREVGGVLNYRLRDGDFFRSFFDSKFWSYEAYGYYSTEELGKFKAGQIWKRFGLDWDGVFFGNVAYFDGFKLDPDYGLSWEKTTDVNECFKVDSFVQYYFHEDGVNGSFGGADAESVPGVHERNTGVVRLVPTWTLCDEATFALGISGLLGEIDSKLPTVNDEITAAWAIDATYAKDNWKVFGEVLQSYGRINPVRFVSGGPSNRITDFLWGAHYTVGPVTYRASYSLGIDDNPHATDSLLVAGATIKLTKTVDFYLEYVNQQVNRNRPAGHVEFFDSFNFIFYWSY